MLQRAIKASIANQTLIALLSLVVIFTSGCRNSSSPDDADMGESQGGDYVVAVNYPLAYFCERIGGDKIEVRYLASEVADPAFWQPKDADIAELQQAKLIFFNGADYAKWREQVSLPLRSQIDTLSDHRDQWIELEDSMVHKHGPEGEHAHAGFAFTTWLDPELAQAHASSIAKALEEAYPEHKAEFEDNLKQLQTDLKTWQGSLDTTRGNVDQTHWIGSHPVYQYLARYLMGSIRSVHFEPDEEPTAEQWQELESMLEQQPTKVMLWEAEPLPSTRTRLESMGLKVFVLNPCGQKPESGADFLEVMHQNADTLFEALKHDQR